MSQRINISLPAHTLQRLDHIAVQGSRSRLIDQAVNFYLTHRSREQLHAALRKGAITRAERDRSIATELFEMRDA